MLYLFSPFWFHYLPLKKEPYHYLRFEKDSRYYELRLARDLLDDWTLTTSNGRIKSKLGQSRVQAYNTFSEALFQLYSVMKLRYQRQYHIKRLLVEDLIYLFLLVNQASHFVMQGNDQIKRKKTTNSASNNKQVNHSINTSQQISFFF